MLWIVQGMIGITIATARATAPASFGPGRQPPTCQRRTAAIPMKTTATRKYSGRISAVRPKRKPGTRNRQAAPGRGAVSLAERKVRIVSGQGLLRRLALEAAGRVDEWRVDGNARGAINRRAQLIRRPSR